MADDGGDAPDAMWTLDALLDYAEGEVGMSEDDLDVDNLDELIHLLRARHREAIEQGAAGPGPGIASPVPPGGSTTDQSVVRLQAAETAFDSDRRQLKVGLYFFFFFFFFFDEAQ